MKKKNLFLSMAVVTAVLFGCAGSDGLLDGLPSQTRGEDAFEELTPSLRNDSLALVAIYDALGGNQWAHSYWKRTPLRYWEGVKLARVNKEMRVVDLQLFGDKLKGELPKEIGQLTELITLKICQSNHLKGTIIDEVYDLAKLKVLDFSFTRLSGELSPRIGELAQLDTLNLWKSQFAENYVDENGKPQLNWEKNMDVFTGSIPQEIGQLTKLRMLNFARCGFTGELPETLGDLKSITRMDLSQCRFTGSIPASLGNLPELAWLALCNNQLSGTIPSELCNAPKLKDLILADNQLTGSIPSNIGQLSELGYLGVENNYLTGAIPTSIADILHLGIFYAQNNQLSGSIPSQLGRRHPWLVAVRLENNQLTGSLPDAVANDNGYGEDWFTIFRVANNRLTGDVPTLWMRFPDLCRQYLLPQQAGAGFDNLK